jgi:hypothetical protein
MSMVLQERLSHHLDTIEARPEPGARNPELEEP